MLVRKDKIYHFFAGLSIFAVTYPLGLPLAFLSVVLIGASKELWDLTGRGTPEFSDFIFTVLGAVFLAVWYALFL